MLVPIIKAAALLEKEIGKESTDKALIKAFDKLDIVTEREVHCFRQDQLEAFVKEYTEGNAEASDFLEKKTDALRLDAISNIEKIQAIAKQSKLNISEKEITAFVENKFNLKIKD